MTSVLVSFAAWLVGCCPVVLEPPGFWTAIANNSQVESTTRSFCITCLVERHAHPGMRLAEFARLFDKAPWLNETVIEWNKVAMCGWIPVDIAPNSTTLSFRVFPELLDDAGAVYFRVSGEIDGESCCQLLHGQESDSLTDAIILEVATAPGRQPPVQIWADASKFSLRLKGRVLGSLIQEGMTQDEVEQILGKEDGPLPTGGTAGGITWMFLRYHDLGLSVTLCCDEKGVLRVDGNSVTFQRTFGQAGQSGSE